MNSLRIWVALAFMASASMASAAEKTPPLSVDWKKGMLTVSGGLLTEPVPVWYLEAYCRPGSTDRVWDQTVIAHTTERLDSGKDPRRIRLRDRLSDGVVVEHDIRAGRDVVEFRLTAENPTGVASQAHWAQPCIRVDRFAGVSKSDAMAVVPPYARKSFIVVDGRVTRLPTEPWAVAARYIPGQVWSGPGVNRDDVNPRPLSSVMPSHGLIGCYSKDESVILATAWAPWQELFQGVITCIHSDFRIGGLEPGERKRIVGRLYVVPGDAGKLLKRYERDFH